ncbi:MAG: sigma-54-dependent Fis family transcriptional regulator [Planctomycetota bacterium]|nr:MAG: sigma-54-dependent Fis family transcriptional regulator [Planctomycetota bacterium]
MSNAGTVLVVDASEGVRSFLTDALASAGYAVVSARDADSALRTMEREPVDVLVSEIFLPGLDGIELLKRALKLEPRLQGILMAAGAPAQTVVHAMRAGAFDTVEKPIDVERLLLSVRKAFEHMRLERENEALKRMHNTGAQPAHDGMVAESEQMREVLSTIDLVAPTDLTVLIEGESGVGKELVAARIHQLSTRSNMPFVAINCGVLQHNLLESELFGHEKGAFTGAVSDHAGLFEVADKGTIFLDEIGELPLDLQVKLLRVLESSEFRRVGSNKIQRSDVRVIAATNRTLVEEVRRGSFREDLYYRLNVINITVPPLRKRPEEIPALVQLFVERARRRGLKPKRFSKEAIEELQRYHWPGNIRELENLVERTLILSRHDVVGPKDLPRFLAPPTRDEEIDDDDDDCTLAEMERRHIIKALRRNRCNKVQTARKLAINVKTLYNKIKAYKIDVDAIKQECA